MKEYMSEIISGAMALLGVTLGVVLNRLSRFGTIKFYINEKKCFFTKADGFGGEMVVDKYSEDVENVSISLNIDVLNTSSFSKKTLRNIKFYYELNNKKYYVDIYDMATLKNYDGITTTELLKFINLNPQEIRNLVLSIHPNESIKLVPEAKWYLTYQIPKMWWNCNKKVKVQ